MTKTKLNQFAPILISAALGVAICLFATAGCKRSDGESQSSSQSQPADGETADPGPAAAATDWVQFRGPGATSTAFTTGFPTTFDQNHVVWKSELVGRGASTPIILGDKVFLTSYSGYGESAEKPGKLDDLRHHLFCFNRTDGTLLWQRDIKGSLANEERLNPNVLGHGFASSTPITDGEKVFVFFGTSGVFAYDVDGEFLWQTDVGWRHENFGSCASLVLHKDLLIVNASVEARAAFALDKTTGAGVWKIDNVIQSWSTPVVAESADGKLELLLAQQDVIRGFDPDTGAELWTCEGILDYVVPTPVVIDGVAYCCGGKYPQSFAVRLGGRGDVTKSHKLWSAKLGANVLSPVVYQGNVFLMKDQGVFQVVDAKTGDVINRKRVKGSGTIFASPLLAGDKIFFPLVDGVLVVDADPEYSKVSLSKFATEEGEFKATLAVSGDRLFTRNDKFLYCIGPNKVETSEVKFDPQKSDESKLVVAKPKYDYDEKIGKIRVYNNCFGPDSSALERFIMVPYESVITPEQREDSLKLIRDSFGKFIEAEAEQKEIYWKHIKQELTDEEANEAMAKFEQKVMLLQRDLRMPIKKSFSKEQMDKHMEEHRAWLEKTKQNKK